MVPYQVATALLKTDPLFPISCIFSWIFSKTLGTATRKVGRTSLRVVTREPWWSQAIFNWHLWLFHHHFLLPSGHLCQQSRQLRLLPKDTKHQWSELPHGSGAGRWGIHQSEKTPRNSFLVQKVFLSFSLSSFENVYGFFTLWVLRGLCSFHYSPSTSQHSLMSKSDYHETTWHPRKIIISTFFKLLFATHHQFVFAEDVNKSSS